MKRRIFRKGNYFIIINEEGTYSEEIVSLVRVTKVKETDTDYRIEFLRDSERMQKFDVAFADIEDEAGNPYPSIAAWETFYTENTGTTSSGVKGTPIIMRVTNSGTISVPVYAITIMNVGSADGTVKSVALKVGEGVNFSSDGVIPFDASVFTYNATGTEFLISYIR